MELKPPCPDCPEFETCPNMKMLALILDTEIEVTAINCPHYRIEV